jgi:hypothetical protein
MEPRPLTKEERAEIEMQFAECHIEDSESWFTGGEMRSMLAAEQYWREAVKNAEWKNEDEVGCDCRFCGWANSCRDDEHGEHKPDCPWVKAQE